MFHVQCNQCKAWVTIADASDPDAALECGCCPLPHHHGEAANACTGGHPGACGLAVDGCTVCRPVTITVLGPLALTTAG